MGCVAYLSRRMSEQLFQWPNEVTSPNAEWALSFQYGGRGLRVGEFGRYARAARRVFDRVAGRA